MWYARRLSCPEARITRLSGMTDPNAAPTPFSGPSSGSEGLAKTASTAYDAALEVIASVEPRIAEATRAELRD